MAISDEHLNELKKLAAQAIPGPWECGLGPLMQRNKIFINSALDPEVILEMVEELEAYRNSQNQAG